MLEKASMEVVEADGENALRLFRSQEFDVVLLDLYMPGFDGFEFLRLLRSEHSSVKVVVMSGGGISGTTELLPATLRLGAKETLEKPFDEATLLAAIERAMT